MVTLITVEPVDTPAPGFCMSLRFSRSASPPLRSPPRLFYFCFEALFNFRREIFPPRNDYCSPEIAEMEVENRIWFAASDYSPCLLGRAAKIGREPIRERPSDTPEIDTSRTTT